MAIPPVLGRAIRALAPHAEPRSDAEFLAWVDAGLPPIKMRCGYRNGAPTDEGVMHHILVVGDGVITPEHPESVDDDGNGDAPGGIRNACRAAAIALRSSGPVAELPIATHRDATGKTRSMPVDQMERLEQTRTIQLAARWLRAGWKLTEVAPLLRHGPGPAQAVPLLKLGVPAERIAEWAGHDLDDCVRWATQPGIPVELAQSLMRAGLDPPAIARWVDRGVPAANLLEWLTLVETGSGTHRDHRRVPQEWPTALHGRLPARPPVPHDRVRAAPRGRAPIRPI